MHEAFTSKPSQHVGKGGVEVLDEKRAILAFGGGQVGTPLVLLTQIILIVPHPDAGERVHQHIRDGQPDNEFARLGCGRAPVRNAISFASFLPVSVLENIPAFDMSRRLRSTLAWYLKLTSVHE